MSTQAWRLIEGVAVWLVPALVGAVVVVLLVIGARRWPRRAGRSILAAPAANELLIGALCFGVVSGIGRQAAAMGAETWLAGLVCILAGAVAVPLLARAHGLLAR